MVRRSAVIPLTFAGCLAALFLSLGGWQLRRLAERKAFNRVLEARRAAAPVPLAAALADPATAAWRRVTLRGVFDYEHEAAYIGRSRRGSPGVHFLTPLVAEGLPTPIVVNRGWAYSPDAREVEFARWRERDTVTVAGWLSPVDTQTVVGSAKGRTVRHLDPAALRTAIGREVAGFVLIQTSDSALRADSVPARLDPPPLDEGNHLNYAIQWFIFAAFAAAGGVLLAVRPARRDGTLPSART